MSIRVYVRHALTATCLASASCAALAAETWHTSTIKRVYPLAGGSFVTNFDTDAAACAGPSPDKYHHATRSQNGMTVEGAAKIYAAALMTLVTDKTVQVAFGDATTGCYLNRLIVLKERGSLR